MDSYHDEIIDEMIQRFNAEDMPGGDAIIRECVSLMMMLLEKNRKYGNSALEPKRIFSDADAAEQIRVRLDDKLSRLTSAQLDETEDVERDLMGYLILLRIAEDD